MTTYAEILEGLAEIQKRLAENETEWGNVAGEAVAAKYAYDREYAVAFVRATGTVDQRKNKAIAATVDSGTYERLETAKQQEAVMRQVSDSLGKQLSSLQSQLKAMTREAPQTGPQPSWSSTSQDRAVTQRYGS